MNKDEKKIEQNVQQPVQQPVQQQVQQPVQQPVYTQPQQPIYQQPMYNQPVQKNSCATAGMVLGIVSVSAIIIGLFVLGGLFYTVALICGIVGIVLSAKGRKSPIDSGQATAGLVLSIVGTSISGIGLACVACACATIGCVGAAASSL